MILCLANSLELVIRVPAYAPTQRCSSHLNHYELQKEDRRLLTAERSFNAGLILAELTDSLHLGEYG